MKTDFCVGCGSRFDLHQHHLIPRSQGGTNRKENLVTLCGACHGRLHECRGLKTCSSLSQEAIISKIAAGDTNYGDVPYGKMVVDGQMVDNPDEQRCIQEIKRLHKLGLIPAHITREINAQGFRNRAGSIFDGSRVIDIIRKRLNMEPNRKNSVPYGYSLTLYNTLIENEDEQKVIQHIKTARADGVTMQYIVRALNDLGYLTRSGKTWDYKKLENLCRELRKPDRPEVVETLPEHQKAEIHSPFGLILYNGRFAPHPTEYVTVLVIDRLLGLGVKQIGIARILNTKQMYTRSGHEWNAHHIGTVCRSMKSHPGFYYLKPAKLRSKKEIETTPFGVTDSKVRHSAIESKVMRQSGLPLFCQA